MHGRACWAVVVGSVLFAGSCAPNEKDDLIMHTGAASEADTRSDIVVSPIVLSSVIFEPSDSIDPLLAGVADHLTHKRWAVAGLVQETVV